MKKLKTAVRRYLKVLYSKDFPKEGICHHLGVGTAVGNDYVGFSTIGAHDLVITVYASSGGAQQKGYSRKRHMNVLKALQEVVREFRPKSKIRDHWNGKEGMDGISVQFGQYAPKSLVSGIANYHKVGNVFKFTEKEEQNFNAFTTWLDKKLKKY